MVPNRMIRSALLIMLFVTMLVGPAHAQTQKQQKSGSPAGGPVAFTDPERFYSAVMPVNPVPVAPELGPDSLQWVARSAVYLARGPNVTVQVGVFHWTPRYRIAMRVMDTDAYGVLVADDLKILRQALGEKREIENLRGFSAFNTTCLEITGRYKDENNPRPHTVSWVIPYPDHVIVVHVRAADPAQFTSPEALEFNSTFDVLR